MSDRHLLNFFQKARMITNTSSNTKFLWANSEKMCDFPAFCDESAVYSCSDVKLISCEKCSHSKASLFLFVILSLSFIILISNILTLSAGIYRRKKGSVRKVDDVRSSLAIADLFTGFQLMSVVLYNFLWVTNSTGNEVLDKITTLQGSASSMVPAILNLFTFTSSLYHLLYMGMQRLHAIAWPINYKFQSKTTVYQGLTVVWVLAAVSASLPAWFPEEFTFSYYSSTMLYWPILKGDTKQSAISSALALVFFFYVLPFILMTALTVASAILLRSKLKLSRSLSTANFALDDTRRNHEHSAFKTVAIMQFGFTLTIAPLFLVTVLFYTEHFDCKSISIPYLICFYLSMLNSLFNVIIYSVRDQTFRASIQEMLDNLKCCSQPKDIAIISEK